MKNNNFILGLSIGIAIVSVIGMALMFFNKDNKVNNLAQNQDANQAVNNNYNPPIPTPSAPPTPPAKVDIAVSEDDWILGKKDATVTIVEFSDIQCPFCKRFHPTMQKIVADYPDKVRWVYKHFPLDSIHPYARKAGEASECAGEQGEFWEYLDQLFVNQNLINNDYFGQLAKEMGLKQAQFDSCLLEGKYADKVNDDYQEGLKYGVRGTPGNFINGQSIPGAVPYEQIKAMVDSL